MKRKNYLALVTLTLVTTVSVSQMQGIVSASESEISQTVESASTDTIETIEESTPVDINIVVPEVTNDSRNDAPTVVEEPAPLESAPVTNETVVEQPTAIETPTTSGNENSETGEKPATPSENTPEAVIPGENVSETVEVPTTPEKVSENVNNSVTPEGKEVETPIETPTASEEKVSGNINVSVQNLDNAKKGIALYSADTATSNSDIQSTPKYVDAASNELSEEEAKKVDQLLDAIKDTEGYAIYADELDRTNHIEGNIYVNKASTDTNIVISRVGEIDDLDKSHIGESDAGIQIQGNRNNVTIEVGPTITVEKPNPNQTIINGGYSNNITANQMTEEEAEEAAKVVRENLDEISEAGKAAKSEIDEVFYADGKDAFEGVGNLMENNVVTKGDVISINVDYKQVLNNEGAFGNLINANNGTKVIVNVIITDEDVTDINIYKGFSAGTNVSTEFNKYSAYIVWNFGDYAGNLNINEEMVGIIVAPKGHVYQAAGNLNGQIISRVAGNNGEVHQVTRRDEEPKITPTPKPEEPKVTPTPEPEEPKVTPTPEPEEPKVTPTPEPEEPKVTPTPEPEEPKVTPTPEPEEPKVTPTPEPEEPKVTPTPEPEEPKVTPTPEPEEPKVTPTPEPEEPKVTPTPEPEEPKVTPTPEPEEPKVTPTPEPEEPEVAPTPEPEEPEVTPTPEPEEPEETPTPTPDEPEETTTPTPEQPENPAPEENEKPSPTPESDKTDAVKTGDPTNIIDMLTLLGSSGAIMLGSFFKRRKK